MRYESWPRAVLANSRAAPLPRLVLVTLAAGCSPDGLISMSLAEIVRLTRISKRGVQNCVEWLVQNHEILVETAGTGRQRTVYRIVIARLERFTVAPRATLDRRRVAPHGTLRAV